ncbi:MAG: hypothetical protein ACT4QF_09055 [Sporichthyaceae bacterium]
MTTTVPDQWQDRLRSGAWWRGYAAMVAAMLVGMFVGHSLNHMLFRDVGEVAELAVMASWMTVGMLVWMAILRDSVRSIAAMVVAMNLPFAVVGALLAADAMSYETASTVGHVGMLATMAAAMLVLEPCGARQKA